MPAPRSLSKKPVSSCSVRNVSIEGSQALRLGNGIVEADVLPELGGRVWNLWHKPSKTQWIWHRPKAKLRAAEPGAAYDDAWAGGWEQLFPNDAPGRFEGRDLPDHGEWWSRAWECEVAETSEDRVALRLRLASSRAPVRCEKWISLDRGASRIKLRYRIQHEGPGTFHFMLKEHLAVAVTPEHRIELPGGTLTPVDPAFSTRIGKPGAYPWPIAKDAAGRPVDLSVLPDKKEKHREFTYVRDLPEGWCGVRHAPTGRFLRLHHSNKVFPYTWLFMTFGGWKGLYTVVLEPCTNMPKDMDQALALGQCAALGPGQSFETEVEAELG